MSIKFADNKVETGSLVVITWDMNRVIVNILRDRLHISMWFYCAVLHFFVSSVSLSVSIGNGTVFIPGLYSL